MSGDLKTKLEATKTTLLPSKIPDTFNANVLTAHPHKNTRKENNQ